MNNPQFYIFGVPDGFDMYNATPERINLFQLLYDSDCRDRRKMAIYRNADNSEVSYIYLRYNMQSVKGRPNSFLGMALTFSERYYCTDIPKLLNLFEEIYSALSKDVILTTRIIPSAGQARYRIGRFAEGTAAIIKIEEFVEEQTRGWFGDCVVPMDETFRLNTQSVSLKQGLYLDTKSEHIIANLKTASWVYLSERTVEPVQNTTPPSQIVAQPNPPVASSSQPSVPIQKFSTSPKDSPKPPTVVQPKVDPIVDPIVTSEQERQKKILRDLAGEFSILHKSISDKRRANVLIEKREKLKIIQQRLNNLKYVVGTKEGNSLVIQISSDINRIDEILRKKGNKKKILFATACVLAVITLLIVFWLKGTLPGKSDFDKTSFADFRDKTDSTLSEIQNGLDTIDSSFKTSYNYGKVAQLIDDIQGYTKNINDLLCKDSVSDSDIETLKNDTINAASKLRDLNSNYSTLLNLNGEKASGATNSDSGASSSTTRSGSAESQSGSVVKKDGETKNTPQVTPTEGNVALKIDGKSINLTKKSGNTYEYEYRTKQDNIVFELQNGHTAKWEQIGQGLTAAKNTSTLYKIGIQEKSNGIVTATINTFGINGIKLKIKVIRE